MTPFRNGDLKSFETRAGEIFSARYLTLAKKTDRLFAYLFMFQWMLGILFAIFISPKTWSGESSQIHLHVYSAIFLGGILASFPIYLAFTNPGATFNRMVVAVSQILFSVLLIHLTGGRIETHFHIFGSLAFLAIYRDWRPVLIGTVVTGIDHLVRGALWPESVYGILSATPWRAFEHSGWVIFEDVILFHSIKIARQELTSISENQVHLEDQSQQLAVERNQVKLLFDAATIANQSESTDVAIQKMLDLICKYSGWPMGHAFVFPETGSTLVSSKLWYLSEPERFRIFREATESISCKPGEGLPGQVFLEAKPKWITVVADNQNFLRTQFALEIGIHSVFAFPLLAQEKVVAVLEFFSEEVIEKNEMLIETVAHIGRQLGQVFERTRSRSSLQSAHDSISELNQSLETKVLERTKELEDSKQLVLSQQQTLLVNSKMSALGEMAGGIAHEINTPLTIVSLLSAQMEKVMADEVPDKKQLQMMISKIVKTTERIARIIRGMRTFSRDGSKDSFHAVNIKQLINETISFCQERFRNDGTALILDEIHESIFIEARATEISQVLLNILNNAHDAISGLDQKWIKISVFELVDQIELRITDSGSGVPPETQKKMFQPFFTTKEIGKGTGMGLSISLGIVKSHGGELNLDQKCENTCFFIRLPKIQVRNVRAKVA